MSRFFSNHAYSVSDGSLSSIVHKLGDLDLEMQFKEWKNGIMLYGQNFTYSHQNKVLSKLSSFSLALIISLCGSPELELCDVTFM